MWEYGYMSIMCSFSYKPKLSFVTSVATYL